MQIEQVNKEIAALLETRKAELEKHYTKVGRLYLRKGLGLDMAAQDARAAKQRVDELLITQESIAKVLREPTTPA